LQGRKQAVNGTSRSQSEELTLEETEKMQGRQRKKVLVLMAAVILVSLSVALIVTVGAPDGSPPEASHEGYEITQKAYISEVQADMVVYRHMITKTEVLTLIPTDSNQDSVFGISFRTIPSSNTGVAHMLEHSVLDGSEKYPTKDPFNDMLRGSLETYLNAFTYDDRTVYTVASRNAADFSNLVSVYLDAVFRPRCVTKEGSWILRQEGWRMEEDEYKNLQLTGVVLNEMKGAYSDPDELMQWYAQQSLFPDTSYRFDSGGNPSTIPTLNYSDFVDFYKKFYHPTNAQIFLYGPLEHVEDGLKQAHAYLEQYDARSDIRQESRVKWQEFAFKDPVRVRKPYQSSDNDYRVMISWLVNDRALDSKTEIAWFVINELLIGAPTSRLQKELQDSGYGDSVIGDGIEFMKQQWSFHVGLQGIETEENVALVSQLIMDTLDEIVMTGFGMGEVASAMNTVEFSLRELNTGSDPRGLAILLSALKVWNYDRDPRAAITFEDAFQELKEAFNKSGSDIFVSLIRERMLFNTHRVVTELYPSSTVEEESIEVCIGAHLSCDTEYWSHI
jgi:Zn-dependent M16 (insulinase) family peptidase